MFALIILVIFGLGVAYFATQNTGLVHILIGSYVFMGIPLYIVVIGAMLFGIFVSWLISMVNSLSSFMVIYGKDSALKRALNNIEKLKKENEVLSEELIQLKDKESSNNEYNSTQEDQVIHERPSLFQNIRQNIAQ